MFVQITGIEQIAKVCLIYILESNVIKKNQQRGLYSNGKKSRLLLVQGVFYWMSRKYYIALETNINSEEKDANVLSSVDEHFGRVIKAFRWFVPFLAPSNTKQSEIR